MAAKRTVQEALDLTFQDEEADKEDMSPRRNAVSTAALMKTIPRERPLCHLAC